MSTCADCGASAPTWASINRGVLLCSSCTSAHRSLGRHVSHVKALKVSLLIYDSPCIIQCCSLIGETAPAVDTRTTHDGSKSLFMRRKLNLGIFAFKSVLVIVILNVVIGAFGVFLIKRSQTVAVGSSSSGEVRLYHGQVRKTRLRL